MLNKLVFTQLLQPLFKMMVFLHNFTPPSYEHKKQENEMPARHLILYHHSQSLFLLHGRVLARYTFLPLAFLQTLECKVNGSRLYNLL